MFVYSMLSYKGFDKMHSHCPHCNQRFEPEPGFFFGAMYVSYAFSVGWIVVMGAILFNFFNDPPLWVYITVVPLSVLLLLPFFFKYSRIVFLYLFGGISYDERYARN